MPPEVKVSANLRQLLDQLEKTSQAAKKISEDLKNTTEGVGDELANQTKKVENAFDKMAQFGRRVATNLKGDMKALLGFNAVQSGLAINNMFRNTFSNVTSLNDAVRKLGAGFSIPTSRFQSFQTKMMKGLGEIGLSAQDAAKTMEGLAGSGVKGEGNVLGYSKIAGQLTSIGNEKGNEGAVAKLLSDVVRARGGDVNDVSSVESVAKEVTKAMETTGASATKLLDAMGMTYQGATKSGRAMISLRGAGQAAIADQVTGGNVSGLLKSITSLPPEMRARAQAMGLTNILGKNGELSVEGIKNLGKALKALGTSPELASQIVAGNNEFGDTIVRLIESADRLDESFKANAQASGDFSKKMIQARGLKEAFEANINRTTSVFAKPLAEATQGLSNLLTKSAETGIGSAAVVGGGALLSATLAAGGARAVMGSLLGSVQGSVLQKVDSDIQKVFVVNMDGGFGGIGGKVAGGAAAVGGLGLGGLAALGVGAGAAGYMIGESNRPTAEKMRAAGLMDDRGNMVGNMMPAAEQAMRMKAVKESNSPEEVVKAIRDLTEVVSKGTNRQDVNVTIQNRAAQFETKQTVNRGRAQ